MKGEGQKTILLVEDEAIIAMSEKMTLERFGYNVIIAGNGEAAVATVEKTPAIDLILMDIDLGAGIDGTEAAEIILRDRDIPVIFLSSHTEAEIVARTEKITSYGFIVKNSSETVFQALLKMVFKLFESKNKEGEKAPQKGPAFEALRESEERFHSFFDNANAGIYRTAPDGSIHLANPALVRMLGYSSFAELADKDLNKTGFEPSYPRAQFVAKIEKHGEVQGLESIWKRKDGGTIIVRENARAIRDAQGKTLYYDGIVEDISEIKSSEKLTAALYGIAQAVFNSGDLDELYGRIHGLIAGIVPAKNFFIALLTDDGRALTFPYFRDEKDSGDNISIQADNPRSLTVEVLRTKKPLLLNEVQIMDRYGPVLDRELGTAPKCWLGVPLRVGSETIGVMAIQDYHDSGAYSQRDVMLLESTAGQVAVAIDRKRKEKALRESVEEFKGYFNMGAVGSCVTSLDMGWIEVNDRLCRMLGYAREELLRLTWAEMTHPDDLDADLDLFNQVLAGRRDSYELEKRFIRKDGQVIHTLLYVTCQRNPDRSIHHFLASLVDISELKRTTEALRQSQALAQALLRTIPDMLFRMNRQGMFLDYKADIKDLFSQSEPTIIGKLYRDILPADFADLVDQKIRAALENGALQTFEYQLPIPGRGVHDYEARMAASGIDEVTTIVRDITESKLAEAEIKRQLAEKEILLKEVHHRIKNNIASIGGLLSMRLQSITNPEAVAVLQDAVGRVNSMRLLYDKLLLGEGYKDIPVKNYVESLADTVMALFPGSAKVTLDQRIDDFQLDSKRLFSLGIIINELLTNKMKYAFSGRKRGTIRIDLVREGTHVTLAIEDDGNVLPAGFDLNETKGFGLMLVNMLSQQLGGSFSLASEKGTPCSVAFDI